MEELTLKEYIKTREFDYFQRDIFSLGEFKEFQDNTYNEDINDLFQLKDVFLFQKYFYESTGVYLVFPIVAKFIHEQATRFDCTWCWNSETSITDSVIKEFEVYLFNLIQSYESED